MSTKDRILVALLVIMLVFTITTGSILISEKVEEKAQENIENTIINHVNAEVDDECTDLMYLFREDDVYAYAVLGKKALYLVGVKFKDGQVVKVDVESEML